MLTAADVVTFRNSRKSVTLFRDKFPLLFRRKLSTSGTESFIRKSIYGLVDLIEFSTIFTARKNDSFTVSSDVSKMA
jgi:hypothetical protein